MFDPNYPPPNADLLSEPLRSQFNGLKALIDAVTTLSAAQVDSVNTINHNEPAAAAANVVGNVLHFSFDIPRGGVGAPGQPGPPFANALVDSVNTVDPSTPAAVGVSFDGSNVRFTFDIPRGFDGPQGIDGPPGGDGPPGQPFAQAVVDGVTTLDPGQPATVQTSFDGSNVRFQFGIPRGNDGAAGEVSEGSMNSAINNAINGTSNNTNGISTLDAGFSDPPTLAELEALRQKMNEMILNGRR